VKLVTFNGTGNTGGTAGAEFEYTFTGLTQASWNELTVPLSAFPGVNTTRIGQVVISNNTPTPNAGTFFLDNIYFFQ
jgi:hypothetical protein